VDGGDEGIGLSGGEIAAIVIASVLAAIILGVAIYLFVSWTVPEDYVQCELIADPQTRRQCYVEERRNLYEMELDEF
jgi:hypothetical protein